MKRYAIGAAALFIMAFLLGGCSGKPPHDDSEEVQQLYSLSLRLTRQYIDSMHNAKDSAEVNRLSAAFDKSLTELNYRFPADIDPKIPEGENDTLTRMNRQWVALRDSLLFRFAHPLHPDSLATDSTTTAIPDSVRHTSAP